MDLDYYHDFENRFRGDREKIFKIFSSYEPLIEIAIDGKQSPILIDVGCGRGEWLQRCHNKFYKSIGIESDSYMAKTCRDHGLFVIEGDAIDELSKFESNSISIITIFHLIEHLEYNKLIKLFVECQRILSEDGVLIMETPSIDNLIVSTKSFYLDHTHINPIHADAISFYLEKAGFSNVKHYYINGGPLQDAYPLKVTRILNGVAQDLCIIATKTEIQFNKIFSNCRYWESNLNIGLTLFEAAIEFDTELESFRQLAQNSNINSTSNEDIILLKKEISLLKDEVSLLKSRLRIMIYLYNILKRIKQLIFYLFNCLRKLFFYIFNKVFNLLFNIAFIRKFFISENFYLIISFILKILGNFSNSKVVQIHNKLKQILDKNRRFIHYNQKLLFHYEKSKKSRDYLELLNRNKK